MGNKNAIVGLVRGYSNTNGYNSLIERNKYIYENIISKSDNKFDVILFHEGNITKEHQNYIREQSKNMSLIFSDVRKSSPKTAFDPTKNKFNMELCPPTPQSMAFPLGYKHMCHFWSMDFLDYLSNYKYIIRIDEDCLVTKFDTGTLKRMEENQIYFSSPMFQGQDEDYVIVGLKNLWESFISVHAVSPYKSFEEIKCPYTNFMIVDIDHFLDNDIVCLFLDEVDNSHGIYSNRWGDLPIWGVILSTLVDPKNYEENKDISYYHGSHRVSIN